MPRGRFITIEGGEGAGKSTQVRALAHRLLETGIPVVTTREPGGTPGAEAARAVLLSGSGETLGPEGEALLFAAARSDHVDRLIRPALARGAWVISDRFADSTDAYQGTTGASAALLGELRRIALDGVVPDLTIVLDLPPRIGLQRIAARGRSGGAASDRFERNDLALHRRRRRAFLDLVEAEPGRCVRVDARPASPKVADAVWRATVARLGPIAAAAALAESRRQTTTPA